MEITKPKLKKFFLQGLAGFFYWTIVLTPYTIYVIETTWVQYWKWFIMQIALAPFLAPPSVWFINWFVRKCERRTT